MRPVFKILDDHLKTQIISEAREILCTLGVEIHNPEVIELLADHGARIDKISSKVWLTEDLIDRCLKTAPSSFKLFDVNGNDTHNFADLAVYFAPGSSAIKILVDGTMRKPLTADYIRYAKLMCGLDHIQSQSTAMTPADVPEMISDSYRLFLNLLYCEKPIITGAFTVAGFTVMRDLLVTVRGSKEALRAKPMAVFSCCPTSPLKWCEVTSQNVIDCARAGIPVEFVAMPLAGFTAPVTLVGTLVQHTAETLSGIVISQLAAPGAPMLYGGSPAVFDIRYETTPMGAIETQMIDCAITEIGHYLGVPTQAYISLSDSKTLDAQAGLETSMGATLAALAGINSISGPGMLDFENCQSLEKLVLDNEICAKVQRLIRGIEPRDDFPARPIIEELLEEKHLLIAKHTRKHLKSEITFPGPVINRAHASRWLEDGELSLHERAQAEVERLINEATPPSLGDDVRAELIRVMEDTARLYGMDELPPRQ